ncbi:MAG: hypothetical protein MAG581_02365 [Deltaproteobacteria bacterium]|jgi:hypothetical protein|nr:hypothetical protein [Deltaproteobacteria bacterium]
MSRDYSVLKYFYSVELILHKHFSGNNIEINIYESNQSMDYFLPLFFQNSANTIITVIIFGR